VVYVAVEPRSASAAVCAVIDGGKRVDGRNRAGDAKTESLDRR